MARDEEFRSEAIAVTGRLITSVDGTQIGKEDFQELSNMRYTPSGIESVKGNTKINTTALSKTTVGAAIHFNPDSPAVETHVIAQGISGTASDLYANTTAIPSAGDFSATSLYSETASSSRGTFSPAPDSAVAYGNDNELLIWGGDKSRCAGFILTNLDDSTAALIPTKIKDYTDEVTDGSTSTYASIPTGYRYIHVASTRQLAGIRFTIGASYPNDIVATSLVYYWDGTQWVAVSGFSDGTASGGVTLAQTGQMTFTSTVGTAKMRYFNNTLAYWYLVDTAATSGKLLSGITKAATGVATTTTDHGYSNGNVVNIDGVIGMTEVNGNYYTVANKTNDDFDLGTTNTSAYTAYSSGGICWITGVKSTARIVKCTVNAPFQPITDIWDGVPRSIGAFYQEHTFSATNIVYYDHTASVFSRDYVSGATQTYFNMSGTADADHYYLGFTERMRGIEIILSSSSRQTTSATMLVQYWDGGAWQNLTSFDRTSANSISLAQSGVVYWNPPAKTSEFRYSIKSGPLLYYYKVTFGAATLAGTVEVDAIFGIPEAASLDTYRFPVMFQNRLCLCNNQGDKNNCILISAAFTNCVFNGLDSTTLTFGGAGGINAAIPYFTRFSNEYLESLLVTKTHEAYVVDGTNIGTYKVNKITEVYGCTAPKTLTACHTSIADGTIRSVVIWQSASSIVLWDGVSIIPIHYDIEDVFDQSSTVHIDLTMMNRSTAFFDPVKNEWHWLWASSGQTTLNKEYVFDIIKKKWYVIDRGTGNYLQLGINVKDAYGNKYVYAFDTSGYMHRLEYGNTFNSTAITASYKTKDVALAGWDNISKVRKVKLITVAKNTTTNDVSLSYYADMATSATKTISMDVANATCRVAQPKDSWGDGNFCFHAFKCSMTTSNESIGFEPVGLTIHWKMVREDT